MFESESWNLVLLAAFFSIQLGTSPKMNVLFDGGEGSVLGVGAVALGRCMFGAACMSVR